MGFFKIFLTLQLLLFGVYADIDNNINNYNDVTLNKSSCLFAAKLYKELTQINDDNLLISPVSIQLILGLLKLGAEGPTSHELSQVLILPENPKILKQHLYDLQNAFTKPKPQYSKEPNVTIANAIYLRPDVRVSEQFHQDAKKYLSTDIRSLVNKFTNRSIVSEINQWIASETNDHIKQVVEQSDVTEDTVMLLLNTLHFKGKWRENGFNLSETKDDLFYAENNKVHNVQMMHAVDYFLIGRYGNITYLELPYSGLHIDDTGDYVFAIYLPDPYHVATFHDNIDYLLGNPPEISNVEQVDVRIPRFSIRSNNHLKAPLEQMGLKHAFADANFNSLTIDKKSVQITDVIHNTALDVSEEGTEASAVTVIGIDDRIFSQPLPFHANRPFLFALKQKSTNIILFLGLYKNPKH